MSAPVEYVGVWCPYCGERFETEVDMTVGSQNYYEDCQICCAPIRLQITIGCEDEILNVLAWRDNE